MRRRLGAVGHGGGDDAGVRRLGHGVSCHRSTPIRQPSGAERVVPRKGEAMAKKLEGSCRCGAVHFTVMSHTPYPYQLCYCSICRKTAGGGGFAINLMGDYKTMKVQGQQGDPHLSRHDRGRRWSLREKQRPAAFLFQMRHAPYGPMIRSGRSWCIPSLRRSTPNCRCRRPRSISCCASKRSWVKPDFGRGDARYPAISQTFDRRVARRRGLWID